MVTVTKQTVMAVVVTTILMFACGLQAGYNTRKNIEADNKEQLKQTIAMSIRLSEDPLTACTLSLMDTVEYLKQDK